MIAPTLTTHSDNFTEAHTGYLVASQRDKDSGPWKLGLVTAVSDTGYATRWQPFDYTADRLLLGARQVTDSAQVVLAELKEALAREGNRFETLAQARAFAWRYRVGRQLTIFDPEL